MDRDLIIETVNSLFIATDEHDWKALHTHHQIGNHIVRLQNDEADVFCYGTATHYLKNEPQKNLWTVVGSHDFHLKKSRDRWKISRMKFNLKYMDGNTDLPKIAQKRMTKEIGANS